MSELSEVLGKVRAAACSNREQGDAFERLVAHYLKTDPQYIVSTTDKWNKAVESDLKKQVPPVSRIGLNELAESPLACFAVCSDSRVGKTDSGEDISAIDLPFPATTNAEKLAAQTAGAAALPGERRCRQGEGAGSRCRTVFDG